MRVVVTGDREYADRLAIKTVIAGLHHITETRNEVLYLAHGKAPGADKIAGEVAEEINASIASTGQVLYKEIDVKEFPAHWKHNRDCPPDCAKIQGRPAGVIRNGEMLETHQPNVVWGFHNNIYDSKGTKDCLTRAKKLGIPAYLVSTF